MRFHDKDRFKEINFQKFKPANVSEYLILSPNQTIKFKRSLEKNYT